MNAEAHGQPDLSLRIQPGIQGFHGSDNPKCGADRALRIVLVSDRIPEVDEQSIAEVLGHVAVKAEDGLRADLLVGTYDIAHVLGIESFGSEVTATRSHDHTV